jgi:hypothetical protein
MGDDVRIGVNQPVGSALEEALLSAGGAEARARLVYDVVRFAYDLVTLDVAGGEDTPERRSLGRVADAAHDHWMRMARPVGDTDS